MKNINYVVLLQKIMTGDNLNQSQLASILGVSKQYVSNLINGDRQVGKGIYAKLEANFPDYVEDVSDINEMTPSFIKSLRKKYKLSQSQFAELLGISQSLFAKLEAGERTISPKIQEAINSLDLKTNTSKSAPKSKVVAIKYCPDIALPTNCNLFQKSTDFVYLDEKLLCSDKNININPNKCFILSMIGDSLSPVYNDGDKIILDTSHKSFKSDYTFAFKINGQCYLRKINILPDKIKCISPNNEQDTFYLTDTNNVEVLGLIIPRIRF